MFIGTNICLLHMQSYAIILHQVLSTNCTALEVLPGMKTLVFYFALLSGPLCIVLQMTQPLALKLQNCDVVISVHLVHAMTFKFLYWLHSQGRLQFKCPSCWWSTSAIFMHTWFLHLILSFSHAMIFLMLSLTPLKWLDKLFLWILENLVKVTQHLF